MKNNRNVTALMTIVLGSFITYPVLAQENHTIWHSEGYGHIIEVDADKITFFDISQRHCLKNTPRNAQQWAGAFTQVDDKNALFDWHTVHPLKLTRLQKLPALCSQINSSSDALPFDPQAVFDTYWHTFAQHYAFSEQKQWDWQAKFPQWRAKITSKTSPKALVKIIKSLMSHINDGHAFLYDQDGSVLAYHNPNDQTFNDRVYTAFKAQTEYQSFRTFFAKTVSRANQITASYFDKQYQANMLFNNFWIAKLPNKLSYLHIEDMSGFGSDGELSQDLIAVDDAMRQVMPVLSDSKGLVIDLRFNGGGEDLVAMKILSYLIDKPLLASRKKYKTTTGFSQPTDIVVQPAKGSKHFNRPIVVLTSLATASAAESFALGLHARKNVTFIGAPSNGAYSDMLIKQLPNGWSFSLSNESYLDLSGKSYEFVGFPVSQPFDYLDTEALTAGKDPALEAAIAVLSQPKVD